jgi:hypothetical protein
MRYESCHDPRARTAMRYDALRARMAPHLGEAFRGALARAVQQRNATGSSVQLVYERRWLLSNRFQQKINYT